MAVWNVDTAHAQASFAARHMMITTARGSFNKITGSNNLHRTRLIRKPVHREDSTYAP